MSDLASIWAAPAAPGSLSLDLDGLRLRELPDLPQTLVSGDLAAFLRAEGLAPAAGLLGRAEGERYAVRLARDRLLAVGIEPEPQAAGWRDGHALTPIGGALAVLEVAGPRWPAFFARATAIDPQAGSPSAAFLLAGTLSAILYRHGGDDRLRLHLDRSLLPFFHDWLTACDFA